MEHTARLTVSIMASVHWCYVRHTLDMPKENEEVVQHFKDEERSSGEEGRIKQWITIEEYLRIKDMNSEELAEFAIDTFQKTHRDDQDEVLLRMVIMELASKGEYSASNYNSIGERPVRTGYPIDKFLCATETSSPMWPEHKIPSPMGHEEKMVTTKEKMSCTRTTRSRRGILKLTPNNKIQSRNNGAIMRVK